MNKWVITTIWNQQVAKLITGKWWVPFDMIVLWSGETPAQKSDTKMDNEITTNWMQRTQAEIEIMWDKIEFTATRECTWQTTVNEIWICNKDWILFYRDTSIQKTYIEGERVTITIIINYV